MMDSHQAWPAKYKRASTSGAGLGSYTFAALVQAAANFRSTFARALSFLLHILSDPFGSFSVAVGLSTCLFARFTSRRTSFGGSFGTVRRAPGSFSPRQEQRVLADLFEALASFEAFWHGSLRAWSAALEQVAKAFRFATWGIFGPGLCARGGARERIGP